MKHMEEEEEWQGLKKKDVPSEFVITRGEQLY